MTTIETPKQSGSVSLPSSASCKHEWRKQEPQPARWSCCCGTIVYRSYEDYCDD
jgi:hypothetical protein